MRGIESLSSVHMFSNGTEEQLMLLNASQSFLQFLNYLVNSQLGKMKNEKRLDRS